MTSLTIKIPEELKARLETESRFAGKSCSAIVRDSLEKRLQSRKAAKTSLYERTRHLCGIFASGIPDLATHPKHMKDYGSWRK